jgi:peptide/nickel transport system substrate-binding protein
MMKEDFKRAGIEQAIQLVEWSAFTKRLREKEFDACTLRWMSGPRGDPTQIWHSSSIEGGSNYISFSNPRADQIMDEARVVFDDERRNAMYREFGRILHEQQPYTWLYVQPQLSLVSKRVRGVRESLLYWQYSDWWVEDAPGAR